MKTYEVRFYLYEDFEEIEADSPKEAAIKYIDKHCLNDSEHVEVKDHGYYNPVVVITFNAEKVKG